MKKMRIGVRLSLGFMAVLVLMCIVAVIGINELQTVAQESDSMVRNAVASEGYSREVVKNIETFSLSAHAMGVAANQENFLYFKNKLSGYTTTVNDLLEKINAIPMNDEEKVLMATAVQARAKFRDTVLELIRLREAGELEAAAKLVHDQLAPQTLDYIGGFEKFRDYQIGLSQTAASDIQAVYERGRMLLLAITGIAILLGIIIAWRLTIGITRPLNEAVAVAETVASGDLTSRIEVKTQDETGRLMHALKEMNETLFNAILQVRQSADTIATASSEIAAGNQDLSSRTEEQASSLEETASSMEELTSTVRQNGDNARQANQLAHQAADVATKGGEAAKEVMTTMQDIADSSNKIVDIISVIDGIAFQTNILALNAAVEAARAGEQGRGFAVVATEVRSLAQRSATAAREIKDLIDDSVSKVSTGTHLVENATTTMLEIGESIRRVNDIMNEITMATQEQVQGIEQVNQAVTEMDTVSQQNAALVEEAAAASESLQDQARNLVEVVSMFNTGSGSSSRGAVSPALPAPKPVAKARAASAPAKRIASPAKAPAKGAAAPAKGAAPAAAAASFVPNDDDSGDWEEF